MAEIEVVQEKSESWSVLVKSFTRSTEPFLHCRFALKPSRFAPRKNPACEFV